MQTSTLRDRIATSIRTDLRVGTASRILETIIDTLGSSEEINNWINLVEGEEIMRYNMMIHDFIDELLKEGFNAPPDIWKLKNGSLKNMLRERSYGIYKLSIGYRGHQMRHAMTMHRKDMVRFMSIHTIY